MHTLQEILEAVSAPVLTAPARPADARSIDVSAYLMGAKIIKPFFTSLIFSFLNYMEICGDL
jgi:hypothetical protein